MIVDRNMERLFDSFLNRIPWHDDDYRFVTEDLKDKCVRIAVRNADFLLPFLEKAAVKNPYIVTLLLQYYNRKIHLKPEHCRILQEQIRRYYHLQMEEISDELSPEVQTHLRCLLAYAVHADDKEIGQKVLAHIKGAKEYEAFQNFERKSKLTEFFYNFMVMIRDSYVPLVATARFCRAVYEEMGVETCKMLLIQMGGAQHRIEIMIENQENEDLKYLMQEAIALDDMELLYALERIHRDLNLRHIDISEEEMVRSTLVQTNDRSFRHALFLAENMMEKKYGSSLEGIVRLEELLQKADKTGSKIWKKYHCWVQTYFFSKKIQYDVENAADYIAQFSKGDREKQPNLSWTTTVADIVQAGIETLMVAGKKLVLEYLQAIEPVNIYSEDIISLDQYCIIAKRKLEYPRAVGMLQELGYTRDEIVYIYMHSHFRRVIHFPLFINSIRWNPATSCRERLDTEAVFANYRIRAVFHPNRNRFEPKGLGVNYMSLSPRWVANHPEAHSLMLSSENRDYVVKVGAFDPITGENTLYPLLEEGQQAMVGSKSTYEVLLDHLKKIQEEGIFSKKQSEQMAVLPKIERLDSHAQNQLNLQYLNCCTVLAEQGEETEYRFLRLFIATINDPQFCAVNPCLQSRFPAAKRLSVETYGAVRNCWMRLGTTKLPADEMFLVYINTLIKQCYALSNLLHRCGEDVLARHRDCWFSGTSINTQVKEDRVEVNPSEISFGNKRLGYDKFIYYMPEEKRKRYSPGRFYFTIDSYDEATRTFIIGDLMEPHEMLVVPSQIFITGMRHASKIINMRTMRDLCADRVELDSSQKQELVLLMTNGLNQRVKKPAEVTEYMLLLQKNNPWKFSLEELDIPKLNRNQENNVKRLLQTLGDQTDAAMVAAVYFNSPVKLYFTPGQLAESCQSLDQEKLLQQMQRYPLEIQDGQPVNFVDQQLSAYADGRYRIQNFRPGGALALEPWPKEPVPCDYTPEAAAKLIQQMADAAHNITNSIFNKIKSVGRFTLEDRAMLRQYMDCSELTDKGLIELQFDILEICTVMAEAGQSANVFMREVRNCVSIGRSKANLSQAMSKLKMNKPELSAEQMGRLRQLGDRMMATNIPAGELYNISWHTFLSWILPMSHILAKVDGPVEFLIRVEGKLHQENGQVWAHTDEFLYDKESERIVVQGVLPEEIIEGKNYPLRIMGFDREKHLFSAEMVDTRENH